MLRGSGMARNLSSHGGSAAIEKDTRSRQTGRTRMNKVYRASGILRALFFLLDLRERRGGLSGANRGPAFFRGGSDGAAPCGAQLAPGLGGRLSGGPGSRFRRTSRLF